MMEKRSVLLFLNNIHYLHKQTHQNFQLSTKKKWQLLTSSSCRVTCWAMGELLLLVAWPRWRSAAILYRILQLVPGKGRHKYLLWGSVRMCDSYLEVMTCYPHLKAPPSTSSKSAPAKKTTAAPLEHDLFAGKPSSGIKTKTGKSLEQNVILVVKHQRMFIKPHQMICKEWCCATPPL